MPRLITGSRLVVVAVDVRVEEGVGPEQRLHSAADIRMVEDALDVRHRGEQVVARVAHFVDDAVDLLADGLVHGLPGERRLDLEEAVHDKAHVAVGEQLRRRAPRALGRDLVRLRAQISFISRH